MPANAADAERVNAIVLLRRVLEEAPSRLDKLSDTPVARRPCPAKWSPKEHLGHLLDSATINHHRLILAQLEENPALPGYDRNRWVELHGYQQRDWRELIESWRVLNRELLAAAETAPEAAWRCTCSIAGSAPQTLQFMFEEYVDHLLHHLQHIGIQVDDLRADDRRPTTND